MLLSSDFQKTSGLLITGRLDIATLRQMLEPRCGVSDEGSQEGWVRRVEATLTGRWRQQQRQHRNIRSAGRGIASFLRVRDEDQNDDGGSVVSL